MVSSLANCRLVMGRMAQVPTPPLKAWIAGQGHHFFGSWTWIHIKKNLKHKKIKIFVYQMKAYNITITPTSKGLGCGAGSAFFHILDLDP